MKIIKELQLNATPYLCPSFSGFTFGKKDSEGENRLNTRT